MIYRKSIYVKRLFVNVCWRFPVGVSIQENLLCQLPDFRQEYLWRKTTSPATQISGESIYEEKLLLQLLKYLTEVSIHKKVSAGYPKIVRWVDIGKNLCPRYQRASNQAKRFPKWVAVEAISFHRYSLVHWPLQNICKRAQNVEINKQLGDYDESFFA